MLETSDGGSPNGMKTREHLEDQEDLVSRLISGITGVTIWTEGVKDVLGKPP